MSDEINVIHREQTLVVAPPTQTVSLINGIGPQGPVGPIGPPGADGADGSNGNNAFTIILQRLDVAASAPATNNGASTFTAVNDPNYRFMVWGAFSSVYMQARISGSLAAGTKIRVQYNTSGDPNVLTSAGSWATLIESAGGHTLNQTFLTADTAVPAPSNVAHCLIRCGIYGGDGVADPTIALCALTFFNV